MTPLGRIQVLSSNDEFQFRLAYGSIDGVDKRFCSPAVRLEGGDDFGVHGFVQRFTQRLSAFHPIHDHPFNKLVL